MFLRASGLPGLSYDSYGDLIDWGHSPTYLGKVKVKYLLNALLTGMGQCHRVAEYLLLLGKILTAYIGYYVNALEFIKECR